MNVTCTICDLQRALAFIGQGIVGKSAILDTVLRVLLSTEDNRLWLSMGSTQLTSTCYIEAQVKEPGSISVPLQALSEFARQGEDRAETGIRIEKETCSLSSEQRSSVEEDLAVTLVRDRRRVTIGGTIAPFCPQHARPEGAELYTLPARLFSEMIAQVVFAASTDEHAPARDQIFRNVWVHLPSDETLTLAASDQSQLALRKVRLPGAVVPHGTLQVPAEAFATLAATLAATAGKRDESKVQIVPEVEQRRLRFLLPQGELVLRLAETDLLLGRYHAPFAPFEKLIPSALPARCATRIVVSTGELRTALKSASGLVRCAQKTGENGQEQLYLEIYRKRDGQVTAASVPVVTWKGMRADTFWFSAGYLKQALSCPGSATLAALELGKRATLPVVVMRWIDGKTTSKDYAYAFAVLDPYLALLETRAHHALSPVAQQLADALPQRMAQRGEWFKHRYLRDAVLREIIRILDIGLPPLQDDVAHIAASSRTSKLLSQELLEKLSFVKKREHERRLASVSELIAILAFAEGGYEVPGFGMRIEAAGVQGAFLALKEIGV